MMPLYSIIIPLYNKAPYVRKAVESVVGQIFTDWELIVVDDGSTDGSSDIAASIHDDRIKLIRQGNAGVGAARNRGVAESVAPYLCFLDADDWWEPTFLEEMAGLIERHPGAGIYGTGYWIVKNGRKRLAPIGVEEGFAEGEINYCQVYARTLCMPLWTGAVCMPRWVFDEAGGFPANVKLGEDFLLWVHVALKHKAVLLNKPLSNYNQDVDVKYRGTHHLHAPEHHMLWHLNDLEPLEKTNPDYKQLADNLRCYNLMSYLLDSRYRSAARLELAKVDWNRQPARTHLLYHRPIWLLKLRIHVLTIGAWVKQHILSL
ncbi:MAG: glycosyltransferase family 2 protein [Bacteroidales bacterium]|nr:glycosyltransferase family 2 protein [Bacteroidales bacterium]